MSWTRAASEDEGATAGYLPHMSDTERPTASTDLCPVCGAPLVIGTADFAETPDETEEVDLPRAELRPGQMVQSMGCTTPGCPGPDDGAVL